MMTAKAIPTFAPVERPPLPDFESEAEVAVGDWEAEDVEEVLLELLDLVLLLLLWELEVEDEVDKVLETEVVLGLVFNDIVVGVLKITSVIPEMTVVKPDREKAELTGTVAGPVNMTSVMPLTTVTRPGIEVIWALGSRTVVGLGIITTGEPSIIVVMPPGIPDPKDNGIVVAEGKIKKGVLLITVVIAPAIFGGDVGSGTVVAEGMIRKGVPPMIVVTPLSPGGALVSGIWVGLPTTANGVPLMTVVDNTPVWVAWSGIFVEPGTAINGVLLIIVKLPVNPGHRVSQEIFRSWCQRENLPGGAPERGIFVAEGKTRKFVPPILVVIGPFGCGDGAAMVVGPTTRNGVLLIIVVGTLESWGGAFTTGIKVEEEITIEGEPFIIVTLAPGIGSGVGVKGAKVTGAVTTSTGVPSIVEICPGRPGGAAASGIVVGWTMTLTPAEVCPPEPGVFPCGPGAQPMIWQIALAIGLGPFGLPCVGGFWPGGFWPGGFWPGGFWPGGFWPGGFWPGGFWPGGFWPGGFWPGGFWPGGVWFGGCSTGIGTWAESGGVTMTTTGGLSVISFPLPSTGT
jgi:hypothetical protein